MKVLTISTMFPNPQMVVHAQFVKQRLDALAGFADLTVVSPIPWFPGEQCIPRYRNRHRVPPSTEVNPYPTLFPRFMSIPAILKPLDGIFVAQAVGSCVRRLGGPEQFDLMDCHLAYPEGYAGALLSQHWHKPFVITLRGHDINDLYRFPVRRRQVTHALKRCNRYFGVSQALVSGAIELGAPPEKGFVSTNGVDIHRFFPQSPAEARCQLALDPGLRYMVSVSHLVKRKGIDVLIRALSLLIRRGHENLRYIIIGKGGEEGDFEAELRKSASAEGVAEKIIWAGAVQNPDLRPYYAAANVSCLASEKEGWPNVVLESMACGTPVVAMATWGVPEIIQSDSLGILVHERTPEAFADALEDALRRNWDRDAIVRYAREHTWERTAKELYRHFQEILYAGKQPTSAIDGASHQ